MQTNGAKVEANLVMSKGGSSLIDLSLLFPSRINHPTIRVSQARVFPRVALLARCDAPLRSAAPSDRPSAFSFFCFFLACHPFAATPPPTSLRDFFLTLAAY